MSCAEVLLLALVLGSPDHEVAGDRRDATAGARDLEEGMRVRVSTSHEGQMIGMIEKLDVDAVRIATDRESRSVSLPLSELLEIELSGGHRSRGEGAWARAKWGALLGAIPGAISLGLMHEQVGEDGSSVGEAAALGAWSGGLLGGLIGAVIGTINPGEKWETSVTPLQIVPKRGVPALSLAISIRF